MKNTLTLSKDKVVDELGLPYDDSDNVEIISDTILDTSRWTTIHRLVVKMFDKFYEVCYQEGSTEYQDERPWEHEEEVTFTEVVPVEKTIIDYVVKE